MGLRFRTTRVDDPSGHGAALLLKGDWIFAVLSDGSCEGVGEASHSGDDGACVETARRLFDEHLADFDPAPDAIRALEAGPFSRASDRVTATAVSALDQALWDLAARREGVPVWRLFADRPAAGEVELYTTINRALTSRTLDDYRAVLAAVSGRGMRHFKCAPFERVTPGGPQVEQARAGIETLGALRAEFGDLTMRVDCHKRFSPESFASLFPEIEELSPRWIEEPCEIGPCYREIRSRASREIAAGELYFGSAPFAEIMDSGWADVVMPDVKHVGGFGPLVEVARLAEARGLQVSPHNPSGPVSTAASIQAAAVSAAVTSVEYPFDLDARRRQYGEPIQGAAALVTDEPGWGIDPAGL